MIISIADYKKILYSVKLLPKTRVVNNPKYCEIALYELWQYCTTLENKIYSMWCKLDPDGYFSK